MGAVVREKPAKHIDVLTDIMAGYALSLGTVINRKHDDRKRQEPIGTQDEGRWTEIWPKSYEQSIPI